MSTESVLAVVNDYYVVSSILVCRVCSNNVVGLYNFVATGILLCSLIITLIPTTRTAS